jgi:hypothetical protein
MAQKVLFAGGFSFFLFGNFLFLSFSDGVRAAISASRESGENV